MDSSLEKIFITCIILYCPCIFIFRYFILNLSISTRKNLCELLTYPWIIWCFSLSIFSFFGLFNIYNFLMYSNGNILDTVYGRWYHAFLISKIPELLDTFFIVGRSKPLVVLQWYHHWATLSICYYAYSFLCYNQFILICMMMNYVVHFFMYAYFGLYCIIPKYIKKFGTFVNIIQTLQMIIATILCINHLINDKFQCLIEPTQNQIKFVFFASIFMYISYAILFIMLFFERQERIKSN